MGTFPIYSKRKNNKDVVMMLIYDDIPHDLRVEIIHPWQGSIYTCRRLV
jgi:hypothetical protein